MKLTIFEKINPLFSNLDKCQNAIDIRWKNFSTPIGYTYFFLFVSIPPVLSFIFSKKESFSWAVVVLFVSISFGFLTTGVGSLMLRAFLYKHVTKKAQARYKHALDETYAQLCSPQNMSVFINDTQKLIDIVPNEQDKAYLNQIIQSIKIAFVENQKSLLIQHVRRVTSYYFKMFPQDTNGQYLENIEKQFNQAVFQSEKELPINSHESDLKQYL